MVKSTMQMLLRCIARVGLLSAGASLVMLLARLIRGMQERRRTSLVCDQHLWQVPGGTCLHNRYNPLLLKVHIGSCIRKWTDDYLRERLKDTKISVHVSETPFLNFENKNFTYQVLQFDAFLDQLQQSTGSRFLYYRSQHSQRKKPSSLEVLALSEDFSLPPDLLMPFEIHSTVLRIASTGLCMWLHYDVCDNFLCCIRGRKRVVLFHPDDIGRLYISGSSSALGSRLLGKVADLEELWAEFPLAKGAWNRRREIELFAGDVLFLPAFWPHCTEALPHGPDKASISVNMFVLHPETMALHDPKDIWANRELLPAQEAIKVFEEKVLPSLSKLPAVSRSFYCKKLAVQLENLASLQVPDSNDANEAWIFTRNDRTD